MATLNFINSILAYDDIGANTNNNPNQRICDYSRQILGITVNNPESQKYTVPANSSLTLFDGSRTIAIDGTSAFSITNTTGSTYRIANTAGTAPAFRTARSLATDATTAFTVSINNNSLVTFTNSAGTAPTFTSIIPGDTLYIASGSGFSVSNQGYFMVIAKTSNSVSIQNLLAVAETVVLGSGFASNFQIYSSDNVQIGDTMTISAGFSLITQGSYKITAVAPSFVEISSAMPLPIEAGILPTATGLIIYSSAKFIVFVETNQNAVVRVNGDVTNNNAVEPLIFDTSSAPGVKGIFQKIGTTYKAIFINRSLLSPATIFVFTAERT